MKIKILTLSIVLVILAIPVRAQISNGFIHIHDIEEGLDSKFYSNSSFGVRNAIYAAYPVAGMIRHNRVDGLFLGLKEDRMNWHDNDLLGLDDVNIHGLIGYSFALKDAQYMIGLDKKIGKWLMLGAEYHNTTTTEDYWRSGIYENAITSFTAGFDYHDYFKMDGFGVYSLLRPFKNMELGISYNEDVYSSLSVSTDYALFSKYSSFRVNPAIDSNFDQISQQSLNLGFTINPKQRMGHSFLWTTISVRAELANLADFSSNDFHYNKYIAEAKTYIRLDRSSIIKWRLMAGSITGVAPDFKNFALGGIGTMRAFGYKFMRGNEMLLSNIELEFGRRSDHNHGWADLSNMYVSVFLDSGISQLNEALYTTDDPRDALNNFELSQLTHNVGVGLGAGIVRFEIAKPIAGAEGHTAYWIRFNPTF